MSSGALCLLNINRYARSESHFSWRVPFEQLELLMLQMSKNSILPALYFGSENFLG